ncbi:MAG: hypothetical protein K9I69_05285 [Ignavibacteriales bacterium]|nr:hypothetical protein [Ignavibacteriales bacterium]MCF8305574.1 hypothetical protein [Ignavibacteriales bacterium]MCF8315296.1 hypothetical protein [Ignavibacteriales bacterium]MCF8436812.1 hypothetical protein [Ignavibacteriales bacterium]
MKPISENIQKFVFSPFYAGLYGFAALFTIIMGIRLFENLMVSTSFLIADLPDLKTSMIGFGVLFLYQLGKNIFKEMKVKD